jgi:hypothetical protein
MDAYAGLIVAGFSPGGRDTKLMEGTNHAAQ